MPASASLVTSTIGTPPTFAAGGTIPDGTYVLTKEIKESGTAKTFKEVTVIAGSCWLSYAIDAAGPEKRADTTVDASGTVTATCPTALTYHPTYGRADGGGGKVKLITLSDASLGAQSYREWIQQ